MADKVQNFSNHTRFFPPWHYVAAPIVLAHFIAMVVVFFRGPSLGSGWQVVFAFGIVVAVLASRLMSNGNQDRIIRLEERLRLGRILPEDLQGRVDELSTDSLIGLRFAADGEVADLTRRVLAGELGSRKAIKQAITNWRADHQRI